MAEINQKIFKAYDIRGVYPTELDENAVSTITKAIFTFFSRDMHKTNLRLVVGCDMRVSSPSLVEVVKKILVESGAEVIDIGLVSTPTFYFAVTHYGYDGGIQVSASHNPKEYNGLKFTKNTPQGLIKIGKSTGMEEIKKLVQNKQFITSGTPGKVTKLENVITDEVAKTFQTLRPEEIKPLKVVADAANAMGATYLDALFKKLSCNLIRMNFELDGTFPAHQPDPLQFDTLIELQKRVISEKADLGIAPDGDGDRVFFIDEKGQVIPASVITALVIREMLKKFPGEKVAFDIRSTWTPIKAAKDNGGTYVITNVGHAFITETMHKEHVLFAGESSGHYFFRQTGGGESALYVILTVLSVMSQENKPISEIIKPLYGSVESGEINFKLDNVEVVKAKLEFIQEIYKDGEVSLLDGLSVEYPEWRFNLRASNTEPLLRLNIEGKSKDIVDEKKQKLMQLIQVA